MSKKKNVSVLVIDDNALTRTVLRMIIQGDDFDVVGTAPDGNSGLDYAMKLRPDIVCLDVLMPDSNGLEILVKLKMALPNTLVLMITASNDRGTVQTAIQSGASGYIVKPFNAGTVLDTLKKTAAMLPPTNHENQ